MLNHAQTSHDTTRYRRPATVSVCARASAVMVTLALLVVKSGVADTVTSLATTEWPPYVSQNLANNGFASEVITQAFTRVGYTVELSFMPWQRALEKVEVGQYDAAYPAIIRMNAPRFMRCHNRFRQVPWGSTSG